MSTREGYHWSPKPWSPSDVQARILDGVARGLTNGQIAAEVGMSPDGVKWHISRALAETGLEARGDLAMWWQSPPSATDIRLSATSRIDLRLDYSTSMRAMARSFGALIQPPLLAVVPPQSFVLSDEPIGQPAD